MGRAAQHAKARRNLRVAVPEGVAAQAAILRTCALAAQGEGSGVLSAGLWQQLVDECAGALAAETWLRGVASRIGMPIGVHLPEGTGSKTVLLAPDGWSQSRLAEWMRHRQAAFGRQYGPLLGTSVGLGHPLRDPRTAPPKGD